MQLTALACHPALAYEGLRHYSGGPRRSYGRSMRVRTSPMMGYYRLRSRSGSFLTLSSSVVAFSSFIRRLVIFSLLLNISKLNNSHGPWIQVDDRWKLKNCWSMYGCKDAVKALTPWGKDKSTLDRSLDCSMNGSIDRLLDSCFHKR